MEVKGRSFLVTGGAGFIGSHLVDRLLELDAARVVVVDSLAYGAMANVRTEDPRVRFVQTDLGVCSPSDLLPAFSEIDGVFHLAAEKHNASIGNPNKMLSSNVQGTLTVLETSLRQGVKKVVFTSSLYAYGRVSGAPFCEAEVVKPSTVYGISKVTGEHLVSMYSAQLDTVILRYLFVYGPRQWANAGYKSVIVKNFERILQGEAPIIYGDGKQTLDYIYVGDAVEATIRSMTDAENGSLFNVGTGVGRSVIELSHAMNEVSGSSLPERFDPPDWTAGSFRVADATRIKQTLGWEPKVSLREGLTKTYHSLKENRGHGN